MTDDLTIPEEPDVERTDDGPIGNPPPRCPKCGAFNCKEHPQLEPGGGG